MSYEKNIDDAIIALLQENEINSTKLRSTEQLQTPYVECAFELGAANGHIGQTGRHDMFAATLSCSVVTDRDRNPDKHNDLVAVVRELIRADFTAKVEVMFPAYVVLDVIPEGSTYEIEEELDVTELRFSFVLVDRNL